MPLAKRVRDPEPLETDDPVPVIRQPNGHQATVEWKPERGVFRIPGASESQPAHLNWHTSECIFRRADVEWWAPGRPFIADPTLSARREFRLAAAAR